eukprot:CAMPEP_0206211012 /NCGR_PEP_ID=MMETSP0166-20121206/17882_1 /ASSEMBLY_ACC=CAM_ASM_000260 /TAXON_ID=95228 /ORGANISM="Vannella robusta, Strain DIVA3 518/3/11/1/6" /LENGTH=164 /DNA_ID=CAMNT_0053632781 /DNA_START=302 /DNA_END=792 /DNA_ORIENTATION=-
MGTLDGSTLISKATKTVLNARKAQRVCDDCDNEVLKEQLEWMLKERSLVCLNDSWWELEEQGASGQIVTWLVGGMEVESTILHVHHETHSKTVYSGPYNKVNEGVEAWEPEDYLEMMKSLKIVEVDIESWMDFLNCIDAQHVDPFDDESCMELKVPKTTSQKSA